MPPKPKFTKEEIISMALKIVSSQGIEALTARQLASKLGTSARPIFTIFNNMEEVQKEVRLLAMKSFENMKFEMNQEMPLYKQLGMKMVWFGINEPKLYQFLFMKENKEIKSFDNLFDYLGVIAEESIEMIKKDYGLNSQQAKILFEHTWIHTFGIGALCSTKMCKFTIEEISHLLTEDFKGIMLVLKNNIK